MDYGQHSADRKRELITEGHIHENAEEREQAGDDRRLLDLLADCRSNVIQPDMLEARVREFFLQNLFSLGSGIEGAGHLQVLFAIADVLLILRDSIVDSGS